jgi:Integrase zinc binding domain
MPLRPSNAIKRDSLEPKKVIERKVCCNAIDATNINSNKLKVNREKRELISRYYNTSEGGHKGFKTTVEQIKKIEIWRNMEIDVKNIIKICRVCAVTKPRRTKKMGKLFPFIVAEKPGKKLTLDLVSGFPKPFDGDSLLVVVDKFT